MDGTDAGFPRRKQRTRRFNPETNQAPCGTGLRVWSLATFRTTSFVIGAILWLHVKASLASSLGRLDTATGFALFAVLWTATWLATRGHVPTPAPRTSLARRQIEAASWLGSVSAGDAVMATTVAGAWNGVYVFGALVLGVLGITIRAQSWHAVSLLPVVLFGSVLGGMLAFTIGAIAGLLYGVFGVLMDAVCWRLFRWSTLNGQLSTLNSREGLRVERES